MVGVWFYGICSINVLSMNCCNYKAHLYIYNYDYLYGNINYRFLAFAFISSVTCLMKM